jgi:hypothetical protein
MLHIGKRSGAGGGLCSWSLQGHRDDVDAPVASWAHWRRMILLRGAEVINEYDEHEDPVGFVAEVEATTVVNRRRQYDWMIDHGFSIDSFDGDWLCGDGFSFTMADFT